jgi:sugar phosphate isomerase/epimerase
MNKDISRRELIMAGASGAALTAMTPLTATADNAASPSIPRSARKMNVGLVTYNVAKSWDFDTLLHHCKEAGFPAVEFRTTHAHGVEPSIGADRRREIKEKCAAAGLLQTSLGTTCEFQMVDLAEVKRQIGICAEFVKLAADIGARGVKVRPNGLPKDVPVDKTLEQIGKALGECGKIGADHGVEIWMEVHGGGTQDPPNARKIMDQCGHPGVGVTWNSNPTDVVNGSVKPSFELLVKHIRCCHINDLWSAYPYRELFGLLNDSGYDRYTLCEVGATMQPEDGVTFLKCYKGLWTELSR